MTPTHDSTSEEPPDTSPSGASGAAREGVGHEPRWPVPPGLSTFDPALFAELQALDRALNEADAHGEDEPVPQWEGIDPHKAFSWAERWESIVHEPPTWLRIVEIARNVLVLGPITVTWLGLERAARIYGECNALGKNYIVDPSGDALGRQPFLLLWQKGFDEKLLQQTFVGCDTAAKNVGDSLVDLIAAHNFSGVIFVDIVLLLVLLLVTFLIHRWAGWANVRRVEQARELDLRLRLHLAEQHQRLQRHGPKEDTKALLRQTSRSMQTVVKQFGERAAELSAALASETKQVNAALHEIVTSTAGASKKVLDDLTTKADAAAGQFDDRTSAVAAGFATRGSEIAETLEKVTGAFVDRTKEISTQVEATGESARRTLDSLALQFDRVVAATERASGEVGASAQRLAESSERLEAQGTSIRDTLTQVGAQSAALKAAVDDLTKQVDPVIGEISRGVSGVGDGVRTIGERVLAVQGSAEATSTTTHRLLEALQQEARESRQQFDAGTVRLETELQALGERLSEVQTSAESASTATTSLLDALAQEARSSAVIDAESRDEIRSLARAVAAVADEIRLRAGALRDGLAAEAQRAIDMGAATLREITEMRRDIRGLGTDRTQVDRARRQWSDVAGSLERDLGRMPGARTALVIHGARALTGGIPLGLAAGSIVSLLFPR